MRQKLREEIHEMLEPIFKALDILVPDGTTASFRGTGRRTYHFPHVKPTVEEGDSVKQGDVVGTAGEEPLEAESPEIGMAQLANPDIFVTPRPNNIREQVLREAADLINGDRAQQYGPIEISFQRHADIWNAMGYRRHVPVPGQASGVTKAHKLDAIDAAIILDGLKTSRMIGNHGKSRDDWVDKAGYTAIGAELALPKVLHVGWSEDFSCYICGDCGRHIDSLTVFDHMQNTHPNTDEIVINGGPLDNDKETSDDTQH